jgi:hypothetical protein
VSDGPVGGSDGVHAGVEQRSRWKVEVDVAVRGRTTGGRCG